jgi:hypothetical protein
MINRREFGKRTGLALLGLAAGGAVLSEGCNVVGDLISYIPYITQALNAITTILGSFMPAPATVILNAIEGGLATLSAALTEYQNDPLPADKATLLAKIETFLRDIGENFQLFLNALGAVGSIASVVLGIIEVVLSTVSWFAKQFATITGRQMVALGRGMRLQAKDQYIFITPIQRSVKQFKAAYNQVVYTNAHPECWMY